MNTVLSLVILTAAMALPLTATDSFSREIPTPPPVTGPPPPPTYPLPSIEKLGNGSYRIGEITINKGERSVSFPAQVNMDKGMLEYLLVHRHGKTHESLLRTSVSPYTLQVAFMLLGFEGTDKRIAGQGSPETPKGEQVRILISDVAGKPGGQFPVEAWLMNRFGEKTKEVGPIDWVFCGSFVSAYGAFMSQATGSVIAIWHDPVALIDNASPGGESNRIWFSREGTTPPPGTPVTVTIKPARQQ